MMRALTPIARKIVVPVEPAQAFDLFAARMTDWWPRAHHIGSAPIREIVIEPFESGRWYTRHEDGSESSTGRVLAWEPPSRLVLAWQITADWTYDPTLITTVELRFDAVDDGTRVSLEHRDLEAFGPAAEKMRERFEAPDAWTSTLAAYAAAAR